MVEPVIIEEYVVPGTITFEYRDFAFLNDLSVEAAEAARCADDQGKFWEYHHYLFYNGDNTAVGGLSRSTFELIAEQLELDTEAFTTCLDEGTHEDEVMAAYDEAAAMGVGGTPTLLLNGEIVSGVETYGDFFDMIEEAAGE